MPETAYSPDPRKVPLQFPPSRNYDAASGSSSAIATQYEVGDSGYDDHAIDFFEDYSVGSISSLTEGLGWRQNGVASGCSIVSRTHPGGYTFKALSMLNGQIGRKMPWLDAWHRLRIVVLWRINGAATFTTTNTQFIGVCSGTSNMVLSATTDNAIGMRFGSASGENITLTAGTKVNYFNVGTAFRFISRRGTTNTLIASGGSGHIVAGTEGYLCAALIRISRPVFATNASSVTYTLLEGSTQSADAEFTRSKNCLRQLLQDDAAANSLSTQDSMTGGMVSGTTTVAFDQSTGVLDTLNITWSETTNPLEIAAVGIRKIA